MDEENKNNNTTSDKDESTKNTENEVVKTPETEASKTENTEAPKNEEVKVPEEEKKAETQKAEQPKVEPKKEPKKDKKQDQKSDKPKKKKKIGLIVSIVIILLAIIAGAIGGAVYAIVFAKTEVDLSKYVTIEFDGYEGYASFDENDLEIDEKGLKKVLEDRKLAERLAERLLEKAEVEENEALKNGDEIEVNFKISSTWLKENKIKLTSNKIKIKVKDLEEPNTVDLFEDLEFSYSGISPDLTITLSNNSEDNFIKDKVSFSMETDKTSKSSYGSLYDVANGDKVKVTATYSQSDLEEAGYVVKSDEYEFTIEGQPEYITSSASVTADIKSKISEKMLVKAKSFANSIDYYDIELAYSEEDLSYDSKFTHADPVLEKMYIAVNKDLDNISYSDYRSIIYGVYKVTYTETTTSKSYDYYITINVTDLVADSEGLYSGKTYYYNEFDNYYYDTPDGNAFNRSSTEVYNAIVDHLDGDYDLAEIQ